MSPIDAASSATDATAEPVRMMTSSGIRAGASVMSNLPVISARKNPDVNAAAAREPTPTDSRCDVIHPPVPFSIPT